MENQLTETLESKQALVRIIKTRFEICKQCEDALGMAFKCKFRKGCCFGRWRSNPENHCPADPPKW
jgi:hypothetical protein